MADFIYDEMVTAESLNNIAVDLGDSDFSEFTDNTPYAVNKLNEITQALVGEGISSALNKFKITVESDKVIVGTGIAFFESGKKLKLTNSVTLPFKAGELYLYENISTGAVSINIGELPTDNYIHLATINENLSFADRRVFAKAKVELPAEGGMYDFQETINEDNLNSYVDKTITIPILKAKKILIRSNTISFFEYDIENRLFCGISKRKKNGVGYRYKDVTKVPIQDESDYYPAISIYLEVQEQDEEFVTFKYIVTRVPQDYTDMDELTVNYYIYRGVEK